MGNKDVKTIKVRYLYVIIFGFALLLILFTIRWQFVLSSQYRLAASSRVFTANLDSLRGSIYAADGTTLAYSEPRYHVYYYLGAIEFAESLNRQTRDEFVQSVAPLVDMTPEQLEDLIEENKDSENPIYYYKLADSVSIETYEELNALSSETTGLKLEGLQFEYTAKRVYPEGKLAAHVLGLTNQYKNDFIGLGGIEQSMNGNLNPVEGLIIKESDARGNAVASSLIPTIEPKRGKSIHTSIDTKLQLLLEEQVKASVTQFEAESGSIIVMDPKTGNITGFANYPTYDPNLREQKNADVYTNFAITAPYEMGSIAKVMTMSAAIDLGYITPQSIILPNGHEGCEEFSEELPPLCTWDKKPQSGPLTAEQCLILSDNICFYKMASLMTADEFHGYLTKFGIGKPTGVDLSGESIWYLREPEDWINEDFAAFSYGHGYLVNTVQAIDAISAVANNGVRMQPRLVTNIVDEVGDDERVQSPTILDTVITEETANLVMGSMYEVYKDNIQPWEFYYQDLLNYKIGMKSGSALIADSNTGEYSERLNNLYVGFDMSPDRSFIMLIRLEKPQGGLSYYNARVMWLDTFNKVKDQLGVPRIGEF